MSSRGNPASVRSERLAIASSGPGTTAITRCDGVRSKGGAGGAKKSRSGSVMRAPLFELLQGEEVQEERIDPVRCLQLHPVTGSFETLIAPRAGHMLRGARHLGLGQRE